MSAENSNSPAGLPAYQQINMGGMPAYPGYVQQGFGQQGMNQNQQNSQENSGWNEPGPSLSELLMLVRKRAHLIIAITFGFIAVAFLYCLTTDRLYTARAVLEIRGYAPVLQQAEAEALIGRDTRRMEYQKTTTAKLSQLVIADKVLARDDFAKILQKYFEKRYSTWDKVRHRVMKFLGLRGTERNFIEDEKHKRRPDQKYTFKENFLRSYIGLIDIEPIHETGLVAVSVEMADPVLAQRIANAHADAFIEHLRHETQDELKGNLNTLREHANNLKNKLTEAENKVADYARENQLLSLPSSSSKDENLLAKTISDMNELLAQATGKRISLETMLNEIERAPVSQTSPADDRLISDLRIKLKEAQAEYALLTQTLTPEYPKAVELQAKINVYSRAILDERRQRIRALHTEYDSALATEKQLSVQVGVERANANDVSTRMVQYNVLVRDADSLRQLTDAVLKELQQTQISAESSKSNIYISDYAAYPRNASTPKTKIVIILSTLIGLLTGVGVAMACELLDNTIETSEDAQVALQLPALGVVPNFEGRRLGDRENFAPAVKLLKYMKKKRNKKEATEAPTPDAPSNLSISVLAAGGNVDADQLPSVRRDVFTISSPQAAVSEALRTIRASILFSSADHPARVLLITSARKGDGKTTLASNLAVTLAQAGHRTVLVDADLRSPQVATRFGMAEGGPGLVHCLTGHVSLDSTLIASSVPNLSIILPGAPSPSPGELVGSSKMSDVLTTLSSRFDYVILDAPPVLPVADALVMARHVDGVVFVVRSGKTERPAAQEGVRRLRRVGANLLGVIVSDVAVSVPTYSADRYSAYQYRVVEAASFTPPEGQDYRRASGNGG